MTSDCGQVSITQAIKGDEKSICPSCFHELVCAAKENQPCIKCTRYISSSNLLEVPCKVGDTVYCRLYDDYGITWIDKGTVYAISINGQTNWFSARFKSGLRNDYLWKDLGEIVFRTRQEAEAAAEAEEEA